jgi:hypothetical protein
MPCLTRIPNGIVRLGGGRDSRGLTMPVSDSGFFDLIQQKDVPEALAALLSA